MIKLSLYKKYFRQLNSSYEGHGRVVFLDWYDMRSGGGDDRYSTVDEDWSGHSWSGEDSSLPE